MADSNMSYINKADRNITDSSMADIKISFKHIADSLMEDRNISDINIILPKTVDEQQFR